MSESTSPSSTSDEGSRSTPSNLPKADTRQRRKRTSDSEDEDYKDEEDEATSKKVVLKKEYGSAKDIKPGMKIKRPAGRQPMSKARASTQLPKKPDLKEPVAAEGKKKEGKGQENHGLSCWKAFHDGRGRGRRGCCTSTQGSESYG